jgi:hypothetical protein
MKAVRLGLCGWGDGEGDFAGVKAGKIRGSVGPRSVGATAAVERGPTEPVSLMPFFMQMTVIASYFQSWFYGLSESC